MTAQRRREVRRLEGQSVDIALVDGARLDDVALVSAGSATLWIFAGGQDVFVPTADIIEVWPGQRLCSAA